MDPIDRSADSAALEQLSNASGEVLGLRESAASQRTPGLSYGSRTSSAVFRRGQRRRHDRGRFAAAPARRIGRGLRSPATAAANARSPRVRRTLSGLADQIPDLLQALALMEELGPARRNRRRRPSNHPRENSRLPHPPEVGRGGMGMSTRPSTFARPARGAEVLPFAAALDGRQLQRFKNEVQPRRNCTPHIVPVYAVGCERGVHYYAMQFIDGRTLARRSTIGEPGCVSAPRLSNARAPGSPRGAHATPLARYRPDRRASPNARPTTRYFRTAARLAVEAAEALDRPPNGIVHATSNRNLLIDSRGHSGSRLRPRPVQGDAG